MVAILIFAIGYTCDVYYVYCMSNTYFDTVFQYAHYVYNTHCTYLAFETPRVYHVSLVYFIYCFLRFRVYRMYYAHSTYGASYAFCMSRTHNTHNTPNVFCAPNTPNAHSSPCGSAILYALYVPCV